MENVYTHTNGSTNEAHGLLATGLVGPAMVDAWLGRSTTCVGLLLGSPMEVGKLPFPRLELQNREKPIASLCAWVGLLGAYE